MIDFFVKDKIIFRLIKEDVVLYKAKNTLNLLFFKPFAIQMPG